MIIVSNWLLGAACLASKEGDFTAQKLAARYYFTQFWAEFTVEVLHDFQVEDIEHRKKCVFANEEEARRKRNEEKNNVEKEDSNTNLKRERTFKKNPSFQMGETPIQR